MKKILLITTGIVHPTWLAQRNLKNILSSLSDIEFTTTGDIEVLASSELASFDGIVTFFHRQEISAPALAGLEKWISGGGGFLGIHAATASFKGHPGYFDILGGKFIGHGSSRELIVAEQKSDLIFSPLPSFSLRDELYFHEKVQDIKVHFAAEKDGVSHPLVWTRQHGSGKVAYVMFGHRASVLKNQSVTDIITRAAGWILSKGEE